MSEGWQDDTIKGLKNGWIERMKELKNGRIDTMKELKDCKITSIRGLWFEDLSLKAAIDWIASILFNCLVAAGCAGEDALANACAIARVEACASGANAEPETAR